ncbi:FtsK/SpoIIIE domain-containing protein [Streptomyces sp. HU2014]|uniref:FtsK/SpoIIIE domain-containing protein n=1 Tax=Streptomyces sp. HU2014 TaxID=2939414 RepID=UPI0020106CC8|nr:FtsK/SpoIIIE domain-containing protein [Streptomyces sp. HU2014]UQI48716.1 FtsK/SpoIIIE domain-containing protein [Streptomyces sp. HU2014]
MTVAETIALSGLAVVLVGLAVLRRTHPVWFWLSVGAPLALGRVLVTYRSVMEACGLTERPTRLRLWMAKMTGREPSRMVPRLRRIRITRTGLVLRIRMQPGQEVRDFVVAGERLRHAWYSHGVHVRALKPGWLEIRLIAYDVLRRVVMPRKLPGGLLRVPVALRSDGLPHLRDFRRTPHELVIGATESGKSVYLRGLIKGLAPQPVALVGIDCKWGVELSPFAPRLSALARTPEEAALLLDELVEEMTRRYELIRAAQQLGPDVPLKEITSDIWGLPEDLRPVPVILIVDEVAELFMVATSADEKRRDHMITQVIRLAQLGRAAGMYAEVCGQRFGSELGKGATTLRAQLSGRVSHRVNDEGSAKMALGDISAGAVIAATSIPEDRPGEAVAGDASGGWTVIRSPFTTLHDAAATCAEFAHMTPELPALAPFRPEPGRVPDEIPSAVLETA